MFYFEGWNNIICNITLITCSLIVFWIFYKFIKKIEKPKPKIHPDFDMQHKTWKEYE